MAAIVLPELVELATPNRSSRHGAKVRLLVWHQTAGSYAGSVSWLRNPASQASAHLVVREDGLEATQLVPLDLKAWHAEQWNGFSVGVEHANTTAKGYATEQQLAVSARIFAWLCWHLDIPPRWARHGLGSGVCYHGELYEPVDPHPHCRPDPTGWAHFLTMLHAEVDRGDFRPVWAH